MPSNSNDIFRNVTPQELEKARAKEVAHQFASGVSEDLIRQSLGQAARELAARMLEDMRKADAGISVQQSGCK